MILVSSIGDGVNCERAVVAEFLADELRRDNADVSALTSSIEMQWRATLS